MHTYDSMILQPDKARTLVSRRGTKLRRGSKLWGRCKLRRGRSSCKLWGWCKLWRSSCGKLWGWCKLRWSCKLGRCSSGSVRRSHATLLHLQLLLVLSHHCILLCHLLLRIPLGKEVLIVSPEVFTVLPTYKVNITQAVTKLT